MVTGIHENYSTLPEPPDSADEAMWHLAQITSRPRNLIEQQEPISPVGQAENLVSTVEIRVGQNIQHLDDFIGHLLQG